MRTAPIFGFKPKKKLRGKIVALGLLITGFISLMVIITTIYGQFTGTFLIKMSHDADLKGIHLSESGDFDDRTEKLSLIPKSDLDDLIEENIVRIDEILDAPGGQYIDPDGEDNYIAYNFYIRNTGKEVINLRYDLNITAAEKKLDNAVVIILYKQDENGIVRERFHKEDSWYLGGDIIYNFKPGDTIKYTFIAYIDGLYSTPEMLGGGVKVNLVFKIDNAADHRGGN